MPIWQLCANLLIPNCLRSNLSYSPLAALELYVNKKQTDKKSVEKKTTGKKSVDKKTSNDKSTANKAKKKN